MDAEAIREIFRSFGPVQIRRMFGGRGIYRDELMFAMESCGELYLKVDEEGIKALQELGSRPFTFETRDGRTTITSFWLMPESALDDPDEARDFAAMARTAAQRAKARKGGKAPSARKPVTRSRKQAPEPAT
ncbi:TfoX/Sxy family protein [Microvirga terrestris]|uniref:TfoX/Sxy family protein n=1 Tax=Microvirga terrestris TaxID=2791024 RepID=A0ABS0HW60_9HYPH|nr:TfoX/Sxy family protein [Microvirga terrestris]MBF9197734.1 TfoX/Sxy family protein [Microvirga terrestris]